MITQHQIQPIKNLKLEFHCDKGRCCKTCKTSQRTACMACKQIYCYECGRQHLHGLLLQHNTDKTSGEEKENLLLCPESDANPPPDIVSESDTEPDPTSYDFY